MTAIAPSLARIEQDVVDLLAAREVGALATLDATGHPSASDMHIAADGLVVYLHTFATTRKYEEMRRDPRVSFVVSHLPSGGFAARDEVRSVQVKGRAEIVTDADEVALAVRVSREQFPWLADTRLYSNVTARQSRAFFRVTPESALWSDHRVHVMWRTLLAFDVEGRHLTGATTV